MPSLAYSVQKPLMGEALNEKKRGFNVRNIKKRSGKMRIEKGIQLKREGKKVKKIQIKKEKEK